MSHARALSSFNTVGLRRHYDYAQLFEHLYKENSLDVCVLLSQKSTLETSST